jgi:hypothetical protein
MLYIGGKPGLGIDMYSKLQNNVKTKGVALFVSMNQKLYFKFTSVIFCKSYNLSVLMKKIVFVSEKMKDHGSFFFWSATPCASPPPLHSIFSDYSFRVHHLVNQDNRQLLAHAMASDFSVAWKCLSKRTIGFCYGSNSTPEIPDL